MTSRTSEEIDCRRLPPFGVVEERDTHHGRLMTPRSLALAAACLLFRQDHWASPTASSQGNGRLSLLGSLCLAAGGCYNENGVPTPPDEEAAAEVLTCTCKLLAAQLTDESPRSSPSIGSAEERLDELRPVGSAESADIQLLLATVHGVHPPV